MANQPTYHIGCGLMGIYAGTIRGKIGKDGNGAWYRKTLCTDEALEAVRDYIVQECLGGLSSEKKNGGFSWNLKDGREICLMVTIKEGNGVDDSKEINNNQEKNK